MRPALYNCGTGECYQHIASPFTTVSRTAMQNDSILPGMVKTGETFHRLKVIGFSHHGPRQTAFVRCICRCGEVVVKRATSLRSGRTHSCGPRCKDKQRELASGIGVPPLPRVVGQKILESLGHPGIAISNVGDILSCRLCRSKLNFSTEWRKLKGVVEKTGYRSVTFMSDGSLKKFLVHRLVLEAFVGPCPEGMEACHNDGDRLNNQISNLRWDTRKANQADRIKHGTDGRGERAGSSKLKTIDVVAIRKRSDAGESQASIQKDFPINQSTVCRIINGKRWAHLE